MKQGFLLLCSILFVLNSYSQRNPAFYNDAETKLFSTEKKQPNYPMSYEKSDAGEGLDIIYVACRWNIDPGVRFISGSVSTWFFAKSDLTFTKLDFSDSLEVDSIVYHNLPINFSRQNDLVQMFFPATIPAGNIDSVTIYYHGVPTEGGYYAFATETHDSVNPVPVMWTLSEPYGAKEWWPCKQDLNDKIDSIDIFVTCPDTYRTASNGIVISDIVESGFRTMHWRHRFPIAAYLVAIAVTNYSVQEEYISLPSGDSLYYLNYYYPEDNGYISKSGKLIPIIQLYDSIVHPYPFKSEKYGHAQFNWLGGMEHQTMSFMYTLEFYLTSHELAHQWFGDFITCKSWSEIWLNEGFADFMVGLAYENLMDGHWWNPWKEDIINQATEATSGSVFVSDTTDVARVFNTALTYKKACLLLHMLRWELGDSAFFSGMNQYINDFSVQHSYATTSQFIQHLETAADTSLAEFIDDWFYGEGYPQYQIIWSQDEQMNVSLTINQTQTHSSVSFFEMKVPIAFYHDGIESIISFKNNYSGQQFEFNPGFTIDSMAFDPEMWILTKNPEIMNGVLNVSSGNTISVYPNPFFNKVYIKTDMAGTLEVSDTQGRIIFKDYLQTGISEIDLPGLSSGVYFLTLKTKSGIKNLAVIKE